MCNYFSPSIFSNRYMCMCVYILIYILHTQAHIYIYTQRHTYSYTFHFNICYTRLASTATLALLLYFCHVKIVTPLCLSQHVKQSITNSD
uniref:Uncharacterized protein n=1 Tax=Amblyomma triste TaxID=251400 RepID=A0A023G191_AMBTT